MRALLLSLLAFQASAEVHVIEDAIIVTEQDSVITEFTVKTKDAGLYSLNVDGKSAGELYIEGETSIFLMLKDISKKSRPYYVCTQRIEADKVRPRICSTIQAKQL